MTRRSTLSDPIAALLIVAVWLLSMLFWVYWLPMQIGAQLPQDWQAFLDEGSTSALAVLFVALPFALGALMAVAMLSAALFLSLVVTRSQARRFMEALLAGGPAGRFDTWLLCRFKDPQ